MLCMEVIDSCDKIFIGGDLNGQIGKMVAGMRGCIENMVLKRKMSPLIGY